MSLFKRSIFAVSLSVMGTISLFAQTLQVDISKASEWDNGFCANVTIYNPSDIKKEWRVSFDAGGLINQLWNAKYSQDSKSLKTLASGLDWNRYIAPKSKLSFGYCASKVIQPPSAPKVGDLDISVKKSASWDGGFCENVYIKNKTDHDIAWSVKLPVDGHIYQLWNARYKQDESTNELSASGVDWNRVLKARGSVEFGYCAYSSKPQTPPKSTQASNTKQEDSLKKSAIKSGAQSYSDLFKHFQIGFGGSYAFAFQSNDNKKIWVSSVDLVLDDQIENNDYYQNIKNFDSDAFDQLQEKLKHSKFLVYWLVEGWQESWFDTKKIQEAMDKGYIPVFNYWWFGDKLINGMPNENRVAEYAKDNERVAKFLKRLKGTKILIMEPEFNKDSVISSEANQHKFASIISDAIDRIKAQNSGLLISLAMTDTGNRGEDQHYEKCGYENCALGDRYEWSRPSIVYNDLIDKLDFISFQEMLGQFSRDPSNPGDWNHPNPIAYSDSQTGIDLLAQRVANFSKFLSDKYKKPVFLPYIAIATATWSDKNGNGKIESDEIDKSGWEDKAESLYRNLISMRDELLSDGLFGFAPMALFDDPRHDYGGYQFFMQNEYHLGIIKSSAKDGIDIAANGDIEQKGDIIDILYSK